MMKTLDLTFRFRSASAFRGVFFAMIGLFSLIFAFSTSETNVQAVEQWKTIAILSVTDSDTGLNALKKAAKSAGHQEIIDQFESEMKKQFVDYDFTRPRGIIVQTNGTRINSFLFAPFKDLKTLPYGLGEEIADSPVNRAGWSEFMLPNGVKIYFKQEKDWAYATMNEPSRNFKLPENPVTLLEGLEKDNLIAAKIHCENVPPTLVDGSVMLGKQLFPMAQMFMPLHTMGDNERVLFLEYFKFLTTAFDGYLDMTAQCVKDCKTMTWTLNASENNDLIFECQLVAKPDTEMAAAIGKMSQAKSETLSFYQPENAVFASTIVVPFTPTQQKVLPKIYEAGFGFFENALKHESIRNDEDVFETLSLYNDNAATLRAGLKKFVDSGKYDVSVSVLPEGAVIGGLSLPEAKKYEPFFEAASKMLENRMEYLREIIDVESTFTTEEHNGYKLWVQEFPIKKLLEVGGGVASTDISIWTIIGLGDNQLVYAYGMAPNIKELLKKAIDGSQKQQPLPKNVTVFTPNRIANLLENARGSAIPPEMKEAIAIFKTIPSDANVVSSLEFSTDTVKSKTVFSGKLWPAIGKLGELAFSSFTQPPAFGAESVPAAKIIGAQPAAEEEEKEPEKPKPLDVEAVQAKITPALTEVKEKLAEVQTVRDAKALAEGFGKTGYEFLTEGNTVENYAAYVKFMADSYDLVSDKLIDKLATSEADISNAYQMKISACRHLSNFHNLAAGLDGKGKPNPGIEKREALLQELAAKGGFYVKIANDEKYSDFRMKLSGEIQPGSREEKLNEVFEQVKEYVNLEPKSYIPSKPLINFLELIGRATAANRENPNLRDDFLKKIWAFLDSEQCTLSDEGKKLARDGLNGFLSRQMGGELKLYGKTLDNKDFDWESYRGKYVLVKFTASWCGPCKGEIPGMLSAYEKYREKGFEIVSVGVWDTNDKLKHLMEEEKLPWTMISEELTEAAGKPGQGDFYGVSGVPTMLLIDQTGKVIMPGARGEGLQNKLAEIFGEE